MTNITTNKLYHKEESLPHLKHIMVSGEFWHHATLDDVVYKVRHCADVNETDKSERTPLMMSMWFNSDPNIVQYLVDKGADINARDKNGHTALHHGILQGPHIGPILKLIELTDDDAIDRFDNRWDTALMVACRCRNDNTIARALLERDADPNRGNEYGKTPMIFAAQFNRNNVDLINTLNAHGADVNEQDSYGNTALMYAITDNSHGVVEELLIDGADVSLENKAGRTVFDLLKTDQLRDEYRQMLLRYQARLG